MNTPLKIFIGYDPREHAAYEVAEWSIKRRASVPVLVTPLMLSHLGHIMCRPVERRDGKLWCPISEAPMATEFAISRFCVPFIQREGWALFCDCDVLCLGDIGDLFALADDQFSVMVVKHDYKPRTDVKMDGQIQTSYARKNWSSVVLWNCSHSSHARLTHHCLNHWPGRDLHAFKWLKDSEIGALPNDWNLLVGVVPSSDETKMLHYTNGGPWLQDWNDGPLDAKWNKELNAMQVYARRPAWKENPVLVDG
jgi:hypothetical protein